jgi:hypothetical protein
MLLPAIAETNGTHTEDDVLVMLLAGKAKLWMGEKTAAITEFVTYPQMRVLNVWLAGGDLEELRKMEAEQFIPFAREQGCKRITCGGRPGLSRVKSDWSRGGVFMYKDL